jgi:sarcosine oxidase subunit beta
MSHPKCILCRCEDVTLEEFREAYADGFTDFESLKRFTGLGTGLCQGKACLGEAALELSHLRQVEPDEIRLTTIRPPGEPLTFAELAALNLPSPLAPETNSAPDGTEAAAGEDHK